MRIEEILNRYSQIERVSEISTNKRDREPELQNAVPCKFDYVLKQEELEVRKGNSQYLKGRYRNVSEK